MKIKQLIQNHSLALTNRYGKQLLPGHRKALDAMLACRSHCGEFYTHCDDCHRNGCFPLSCGHRSCPQCQHQLCEAWYERQQHKQLPVTYFLVTFTLPIQLRETAWQHQSILYDILFRASIETLQTVGKNNFGLSFGMTAVLHTHKRNKGYHPHIHIVLPGGGLTIKDSGKVWKTLPQNFILNEFSLARVFRGIFLRMIFEQSFELPLGLPKQWVSKVINVGPGDKALKYLSRYLYRGVISENDILTNSKGRVTFRYKESKTRKLVTTTLPAVDFLWTLLKHVLPRGLRRVRDYGFLHGNAKKTLQRIQKILHVKPKKTSKPEKKMVCFECKAEVSIEFVLPKPIPMQFRFYPSSLTIAAPS